MYILRMFFKNFSGGIIFMNAIIVFCFLSLLLVAGKLIRLALPILQRLYLPSSIIGGGVGLLVLSLWGKYLPDGVISSVKSLPDFLINVIFAALFLGTITPKVREIFKMALPQLCMGQLLAWGQYVIGLGLAGFLFLPLFGINPAFGNLLEIGFEGGHGTVGGMILGILLGMVLINWALNKGIISSVRTFNDRDRAEKLGIYNSNERPAAGKQTVLSDSIDSLAWHIALIGLSILLGYIMLTILKKAEIALFPLCMIGGVIIQKLFQKLKVEYLIDHGQMQRLSGAALDFLVVAAVATIQLSVVAENWLPLLIMIAAGTAWSLIAVLLIAPKLFKRAWFECAIAEFGQGLGVTATGLMLLRTVDPENKTVAAASFGYKQLIHEPIMGGGLWTAFALTLVFTIGWMPVWIFSSAMLIVWGIITLIISRKK